MTCSDFRPGSVPRSLYHVLTPPRKLPHYTRQCLTTQVLHPGFEPGLPRPQRGVLTTRLMGRFVFKSIFLTARLTRHFCMVYFTKGLPGFEPGSKDSESLVITDYTTGPILARCEGRTRDLGIMRPTRYQLRQPSPSCIFCLCSLWDSNPRLRREPNLSRSP